jgi:hypothetical protein
VGAAAEVIPFMLLLALEALVGFYLLSYAAHSFLTVVQETAAGNDEVRWPDEPLIDRFWRVFYLTWVAVCSAAPAVLVLPLLYGVLPKGNHVLKVVLAGAPVLWLLFPLCLLSTLSAGSYWVVVHPGLLRRAGKRPGSVAAFYGLTALLGAGLVLLLCVALGSEAGVSGVLVLPGAPAAAAAVLIYARFVGRLGWLLSRVRVGPARKRRPPKRERTEPVQGYDPWAVSEEKRPRARRGPPIVLPLDGPVTGYDLEDEVTPEERQAAKQSTARPSQVPFDGPAEPYEVSGEEPPPQPQVSRSEREEKLARPRPAPAVPRPWTGGTWTFPWYPSSVVVWLWLTLGFLVVSVLFLLQMRFAGFLRGS